jgi:hypothetical protein
MFDPCHLCRRTSGKGKPIHDKRNRDPTRRAARLWPMAAMIPDEKRKTRPTKNEGKG